MQLVKSTFKFLFIILLALPIVGCCLTDRSNGNRISIDETTGAYTFTSCSDSVSVSGVGKVSVKGGIITLENSQSDHHMILKVDRITNRGTAALRVYATGKTYTISSTSYSLVCLKCDTTAGMD
ncbi:MAG: hypothetical protein HY231_23445 [Acidobacteria bacterium]|nr:hypothetical protein [Acidobacteriota bacterium]